MYEEVIIALNNMLTDLDLNRKGYSVSYCRYLMNDLLVDEHSIDNRKVKSMLINHFKDKICFTYSISRRKSQIFFSAALCNVDVVGHLRGLL